MRFSTVFIALAVPFLVSALPMKRDPTDADVLVVTFADVLEQLETQFYTEALNKFKDQDFTSAGFTSSQIPGQLFKSIQNDEATHSTALRSILKSFGKSPVETCKFNFDAALTDVATMAATARVVENVGVGAYLGGATLISDPVLLDAAGSILTVEARHNTILNVLNSGSAIPAAFDIPLAPSEVLALAGPFISGCDLGIPANTPLQITNQGTPVPGTKLEFKADSINGSTDGLFCQMLLGGQPTAIPLPFNDCVVPDGINGPVAIFVTKEGQPLVNNVRDRAANIVVAGPAMAYIDTVPEMLSGLARTGGSAVVNSGSSTGSSTDTAGETTTTQTITPEEASSIIAGASPTQAAANAGSTPAAGAPAPNNNPAVTPGGPSAFTGKSADGSITVNGWINAPGMPAAQAPPA